MRPGADDAASGTALRAAVAEAADTASAQRPLQLQLEPGVYDLGGGTLYLPSYVDLVGAGVNTTTVRGTGVMLVIRGTSTLRDLALEGREGFTVEHQSSSGTLTLSRVRIEMTGTVGGNVALVLGSGTGTTVVEDAVITATATQGGSALGVMGSVGPLKSVRLSRVRVSATSPSGPAYGVSLSGGGAVELSDAAIFASGSNLTYGMQLSSGTARLTNVRVEATQAAAGAGTTTGLLNTKGSVLVQGGSFAGNTASLAAVEGTIRAAHVQLDGPRTEADGGTVTCFGTYDSALAAVSCP